MIGLTFSGIINLFAFILHVTGSGSFPQPLSAQEEKNCFRRMKNGSKNARSKIIEHNLRLVAHIVKKYYMATNDQDDLVSIGTIGLIKAVDSFDAEKGIKLSSYAARCIENSIITLWLQIKIMIPFIIEKIQLQRTMLKTTFGILSVRLMKNLF